MSVEPTQLAVALTGRESIDAQSQLRTLAQRLGLPVCDAPHAKPCKDFHFTLTMVSATTDSDPDSEGATRLTPDNLTTNNILALTSNGDDFKGNVHIDFVHGKLAHRRQFGGGRGQTLPRAIGMKHDATPVVFDATAGLGRDAFVLASLGAQVTMIERSPILAALLEDGLKRLADDPELAHIANAHLQLVHANAIEWLQEQTQHEHNRPDVVYLDPMYPHRSKSALVKKEMRALRALVGDDDDAAQLLKAARHCATKRVVVKRPRGAPLLDDSKPSGNVQSKNTRYDIYSVIATPKPTAIK